MHDTMELQLRREDDRRHQDRRRGQERRSHPQDLNRAFPTWQEQKVQFFTRYLFWALGLTFFNFAEGIEPVWISLGQLNLAYGAYFLLHTSIVVHAARRHDCPPRYRLAMWVDIAIVSISVLNDPYALPPSMLVFIMVVLGNGMRYGMRMFGEALAGCFGALMLVFSLRYMGRIQELSAGLMFLNLFGAIILIYSYILMSRIERSRMQLEQRSRLDTLTGLMNRRALYESADYLFSFMERHGGGIALILADLDRFKAINDSYGHARGDEVLQRFADILQHSVRTTDIAARLGGDEFVLLLPEAGLDEAETVAKRIQDQVREYARGAGLDFGTTIAFGEAPAQGRTLDELLQRVDEALYLSKGRSDCTGIQRVQMPPHQEELSLTPELAKE